jgi:hypothetical protein
MTTTEVEALRAAVLLADEVYEDSCISKKAAAAARQDAYLAWVRAEGALESARKTLAENTE